jgi:hypothetical protein
MKKKRSFREVHKQSLGEQILAPESHGVRTKPRKKSRRLAPQPADPDTVDPGQSAAILSLAREQQQEEEVAKADAAPEAGMGAAGGAAAVHTVSAHQHGSQHSVQPTRTNQSSNKTALSRLRDCQTRSNIIGCSASQVSPAPCLLQGSLPVLWAG